MVDMKRKEFIKEIRSLESEKLKEKLISLCQELLKTRFQSATGQLQKPHLLKTLRKQIALVNTVAVELDNKVSS
jgi:large subunit ribosomal protein L29